MISDAYRALQKEMHARGGYGMYGHKWAQHVLALAANHQCETILDYGCGTGSLKTALDRIEAGVTVAEYDPAIDGKDKRPLRADLVVCADVLEHVEPEHIDRVLSHLARLTRKVAFFVIATRPAVKLLPDGRNAHILLESPAWWRAKLLPFFDIVEWSSGGKQVVATLRPIHKLGTVKTKGAVTNDDRFENAKRNMAVVKKRVEPAEPHGRVAILAAYGPSLRQSCESLDVETQHGDLVSVSGAHDFVLSRGFTPLFHIECDPRPHKADMVTPQKATRYLLASCCDPGWVARLANDGHDVALWHLVNGQVDERIDAIEPNSWHVLGGSSVGLRAIMVLHGLGYRTFILHGLDCSYADNAQHAGHHTGNPKKAMRIRCGERWFDTHGGLVAYARQFFDLVAHLHDSDFYLRGDGLLQEMVKQAQGSPE